MPLPRVRLVFLLCACVATSTECDSWDDMFFYCCYCTEGSALQVLCRKMDQNGEMFGSRSRLKALEFLLLVGADPNKRSLSPGDIAIQLCPTLASISPNLGCVSRDTHVRTAASAQGKSDGDIRGEICDGLCSYPWQ